MKVSKQKDTYTVTAEKEINNVHYSIEMKFNDEGLKYGNPKMSNITSLKYYRIVLDEPGPNATLWDDVNFTLSNLKFNNYYDNSKYTSSTDDDQYCTWKGVGGGHYSGFTMDELTGYFYDQGESTTFYFHEDNSGEVNVQLFYKCADIEKYK